jgi:predicted acyltransferase
MVLANYLADVASVPSWLKHARDVGLTAIDLIAPFFIFAIGLTFGPSYRRRFEHDGMGRTWGHFLRRFLAIIGIGAVFSAGEALVGLGSGTASWGVLQAIGVAGIVTLLVLSLPLLARLAAAFAILASYQLLLNAFWLPTVLRSGHGGMQGALSWSAMLVLSTVVADFWRKRGRRELPVAASGSLALAAGIALTVIVPISKNRVSASYVLVSLGASSLLFSLVQVLVERLHARPALLSWWGANPLLLYVLHYVLLGLFVLPGIPWWHIDAPLLLAAGQCVFLLAALSAVAWLLARKRLKLSL